MEPEKLQFLMNFAQKEKPKTIQEAMPFLLKNINEAKKENINFSKLEIQLIAEQLTKDLSPSEKVKVDKIMSIMLK